jgi:Tetratricopeptide repeat
MLEKHEDAVEYTQLEMEVMTNLNGSDDVSVAFCLQRLGAIYYGIGNLDKALDTLNSARTLLK